LFPEAIIPFMFPDGPTSLITKFGYLAVAAIVGLESVGLPLPGEATLVTAAVYAGTTQQLNIWLVIASAVAGAVVGDNVGFWLGRELGFRLLIRYGSHVGLKEGRIKVGQYLFQLHGGKIVLFGRFFPVLRIWAAVLAGVNQMAWPKFLLFNAAGAVLWATLYGLGAYYLGHALESLTKPAAFLLGIAGVLILVTLLAFTKRHEAELTSEAEAALPGPIGQRKRKRRLYR
jgi:membrane protein DedA with SNARE-associated domain